MNNLEIRPCHLAPTSAFEKRIVVILVLTQISISNCGLREQAVRWRGGVDCLSQVMLHSCKNPREYSQALLFPLILQYGPVIMH